MISFIFQAETATQDVLDWLNEQIDVGDLPQMFQDADSGVGHSLIACGAASRRPTSRFSSSSSPKFKKFEN